MVIWGHKTIAMFDIWTLQHIASGIYMASVASFIVRKTSEKIEISQASRKFVSFLIVIAAAFLWECAEHYVESGIIAGNIGARVTFWFQGVEHWSNRLIGDTLAVILGFYIYNLKNRLAIPAKLFSLLWMGVHIFVFPDSMYLHRLIFRR